MSQPKIKIGFLCSEKKWNEIGYLLQEHIKEATIDTIHLEHIPLTTPYHQLNPTSYEFILQKDPRLRYSNVGTCCLLFI